MVLSASSSDKDVQAVASLLQHIIRAPANDDTIAAFRHTADDVELGKRQFLVQGQGVGHGKGRI